MNLRLFFIVSAAWTGLTVSATAAGPSDFSARAINPHEHFTTLASYEDFIRAYKVWGTPLAELTMREVSAHPYTTMEQIFGREIVARALGKDVSDLGERSFREVAQRLAEVLSAPTELVQRSFFEFTSLNLHSPDSLEEMGWDVRSSLVQPLMRAPHALLSLFAPYLERNVGGVLQLSVSARSFFDPTSGRTLQELVRWARSRGSAIEYFVVLQRDRLIHWPDREFTAFLEQLEARLARNGQGTGGLDFLGVDLVGSLHEGRSENKRVEQLLLDRMQGRLASLLAVLSSHGGRQFRMHGWEVPNGADGDFYRAFWELVDRTQRGDLQLRFPAIFRIGHISGLTEADRERFVQARASGLSTFVFEANFSSNAQTHAVDEAHLVETIRKLDAAGFPVVLGTDGIGILGTHSSIAHTVERLRALGLEREVLDRIGLDMRALAAASGRAVLAEAADYFAHRKSCSDLME